MSKAWKFRQKIKITMIDISFKNFLTKEWRDISMLNQFSRRHNTMQEVASNMQKIT